MKLVFSSPTYGPVEPKALISQRVAIMHAASNGNEWLGDASPNRMTFEAGRNAVAQAAMESDADAVFWCDSDVILPPYAITKLAAYGKDFVTGIYFQREGKHSPLVAWYDEKKNIFNFIGDWEPNVLAPVDGCGFGCVLTSTAMLRKMAAQFEDKTKGWFTFDKFSEDFNFCLRARAAGYQLWVDTSVLCGHLKDPEPVTIETYRQLYPERLRGYDNGAIRSSHETGDLDTGADGQGCPTEAGVPQGAI